MRYCSLFFGLCVIGAASLQSQPFDPTPPVTPNPAVINETTGKVIINQPPPAAPPVVPVTEPPVELPSTVRAPVALRVVGSNIKNMAGEYLGRVESVIVNGENSQTEYAMVLVNYPTNTSRYTPVPWGELNYVWDQGQVGGYPGALQVFTLNMDRATLERAPSIDRTQWQRLRDPAFVNQITAFFGANDNAAVGTAPATTALVTGTGQGVAGTTTIPAGTPAVFSAGTGLPTGPFLLDGVAVVPSGPLSFQTNFQGTNFVIRSNVVVTNAVAGGVVTNRTVNITNFQGTAGGQSLVTGTGATFPGGTNLATGTATTAPTVNPVQGTGIGAPTGRQLQPSGVNPVAVPPPSTVAPPGVIAPQVPPPAAAPVLPTAPETAQPAAVPSTVAPPGTVAPRIPQTPNR